MLADKKHLQEWLKTGKKEMRADSPDVDAMLRNFSETLLHNNLITKSSLDLGHKVIEGFSFELYQPWYKASPVGMVHDIGLTLDGKKIPRDAIHLILKGGQRIMLYDARTIQDIWWNIVEPLVVFAAQKGGLTSGKHELEVILAEEISAYYELPLNMLMAAVKTEMKVK
jgi:hypothetical protein